MRNTLSRRARKGLAWATSAVVATAGLMLAPTAAIADESPTVTVTEEVPLEGGPVTVTGTGFNADDSVGIYLGLGPAGLPGFYAGSGELISSETVYIAPDNENEETDQGKTAKMDADGSFEISVNTPAFAGEVDYALYTSKAHGQGTTDRSQDTVTPLVYPSAPSEDDGSSGDEENAGDEETPGNDEETADDEGEGGNADDQNGSEDNLADVDPSDDNEPVNEDVDSCVVATGATLNWGVKQSFRNYLNMPFAGGNVEVIGGVSDATPYVWSGGTGSVSDDATATSWRGGVHFTGHDGALDLKFTNPTVKTGEEPGLYMDVESREFISMTEKGDVQNWTQVKIADFVGTPQVTNSGGNLSIKGEMVLAKDGVEPFGKFYSEGDEMDPLIITAKVSEYSCADGIPDPEEGTSSGNKTATNIVQVAANQPQEEADVCVAREVTGGDLSWGVKDRFRSYVTGKIAKGSVSESGFGGASGAVNVAENGIGSAQFGGSTHFTGHKGILDMTLSNPKVQLFGNGSGVLYLDVQANDRAGNPSVSASGVAFANLSGATPAISGDSVSVSGASATLTSAGASAFGGFYSAGEALDSVSFNVSLGGEVPCGDDTNPSTLAETGSDLQPMLLAGAAFIALMGMALMRASRRRAQQVR
ncbi:MAG: HtaA domain-containing protein [Canibacter sp.]